MTAPLDVLEMLDAYKNVPCTWGRSHDKDEITEARAAVAELIEAASQAVETSGSPYSLSRLCNALASVRGAQ